MKRKCLAILMMCFMALLLTACGSEQVADLKALKAMPKAFVGSETCKMCHLEHFDSWMMTLHSRMTQDPQKNKDVLIADLQDEKKIRADLAKIDKLKVPADQIFIPKVEDVKYTIGSQWKQRFIVEKNGLLYIAPIQYFADTDRWVNYNEATWEKNPWLLKCGGCHATGVDLEKQTFVEPSVGCEACHGKGSWHAALPKTAVFEKRQTIVNPAKLTSGVAVQICGSCHNRGDSTKHKDALWPVGYEPGKALESYFKSISSATGDTAHTLTNEFSKAHHQQYIDWKQSKHHAEGVTCVSCHYVHQIGVPPTRTQTQAAGSKQCFECHVQVNQNMAHSIHSFANCVGCHMPRIVTSAESGDLHSHVFTALLPSETIKNKSIPNSCQTCHKHKNEDLNELQAEWDALAKIPKPVGKPIEPISYKSSKKAK
ncbi:MAG: ammonia-forming cytochrome c nitrite reductase subunit c552 [Pseudomonadota bacterium]